LQSHQQTRNLVIAASVVMSLLSSTGCISAVVFTAACGIAAAQSNFNSTTDIGGCKCNSACCAIEMSFYSQSFVVMTMMTAAQLFRESTLWQSVGFCSQRHSRQADQAPLLQGHLS
jgi:hypothetical protein